MQQLVGKRNPLAETEPLRNLSPVQKQSPRRFSLAPMMAQSDRHCRYLWRLISRHAMLYTEMVTSSALIHGRDSQRFLQFNSEEHPVALQLGGSDAADLARCAQLGQEWGYDEINLNCGCPSDRVQTGRIGACLMAEPDTVARCMAAMTESVDIPVTIKHRIGIDNQDEEADLWRFVETIAATGCRTFVIHARKAWLQGLSPKQNREVPPLSYQRVYRLKAEFPQLEVIINGGIGSLDQAQRHLEHVDGVMVGRQAYTDPYFLTDVDPRFFADPSPRPSRAQILARYHDYCVEQLQQGVPWRLLMRPVLGLFHGQPGGKRFRRFLSTAKPLGNAQQQADLLVNALEYMGETEPLADIVNSSGR